MKKIRFCLFVIAMSFSLFAANCKAQNINSPQGSLQDQNTMSVLWFQSAGEAKALYYQGYSIGKMRLDEILTREQKNKHFKPAIVLDIDETILDNSPKYAESVITSRRVSWTEWINKAAAKPLPGAIEFLKYADSRGVAIYYISNRSEAHKAATIKNLQSAGAPQAIADHVLLKQPGEKGKETRRRLIAQSHEIVLLFGDNLGDFSGFDGLATTERNQAVDQHKNEFGKKLIVFPNPMYGDWEGAIYRYDYIKTQDEMARIRKENLKP